MDAILDAIRTLAIWEANGFLALAYAAWEHIAALLVAGAFAALLFWTPPGRRGAHPGQDALTGQRPWVLGIGLLTIVAALCSPPPAPALLAAMAVSGALAVTFDRFNPDGLRWRVAGGLALYALAALAYLAYGLYLGALDAAAWAQALGGQGEAAQALAQGRAFVDTLATWGLWLILPLGYFSLLAACRRVVTLGQAGL
jgi:hypothetical protein